jgi:hypothetical protein
MHCGTMDIIHEAAALFLRGGSRNTLQGPVIYLGRDQSQLAPGNLALISRDLDLIADSPTPFRGCHAITLSPKSRSALRHPHESA